MLKIILLTHSREMDRANNTGQLVKQVLGDNARVVEWHRKQPDAELLAAIEAGKVGLVFPSDEITQEAGLSLASPEYLVIIDATWQEARKMFNQSPYLKELPKVSLVNPPKSIYPLRRNQIEGGLCTAECVALLLNHAGESALSTRLTEQLMAFVER
ncbi:tRNA-uridine aminocarboxypropyltransferase [Shewanella frigidimarina]|uniref:tRNA-uridine aminocarboxypropyltransferase n=1 Tax=Shewanella frigidimarina (strain NCIMB 400) TaxID=318167 RepID=Q085A6_SHEFN|nr:tRNA-uridine aminocarboxypropyltransferase [Shewanella frigidimarina]ABI71159.1 DTW domain containing protein [Shewanella frigidimarina NCIMB 400]